MTPKFLKAACRIWSFIFFKSQIVVLLIEPSFCKYQICQQSILCYWSLSIPPKENRKSEVFWSFQGVKKESSSLKGIKFFWHKFLLRVVDTIYFNIVAPRVIIKTNWSLVLFYFFCLFNKFVVSDQRTACGI